MPPILKKWWTALKDRNAATAALKNFETGEAVLKTSEGDSYGPVYVPYHDYRVLYGESKK